MKRIALLITGISLLFSSCQKTEAPVSVSPAVPQNVRLAADNASGDIHTLIFRWDEVSGAEKYNARLEDMEGNLLKEIPTPKYMTVSDANAEIFSNRNTQGEFEFFHTSNDTIFLYDATANRLVSNFTITFPDPDNKPIHIYRSTPQGIFANCYFWDEEKQRPGEGNTYFIDRKTGKSTLFHVVNDFYGYLSAGTNFNQGYWYLNMQPEKLKELIEEHLASGNCPEEARQKLKDLAATLHENDNNVLMFGKLKQP